MATYVYACTQCEHRFERVMKMDDRNLPTEEACPNCSMSTVEMQICAPALGDSVRLGITRPDGGFSEVLQKIHHNNRGSKLHDSRYI